MPSGFNILTIPYSKTVRALMAVVGILLIALLVFTPYLPANIRLKEGQISTRTIVAPRFIELESHDARLQKASVRYRKQANLEKIFTVDDDISQDCMLQIGETFKKLRHLREAKKSDQEVVFPEELSFLSPSLKTSLLLLDSKSFTVLEYLTNKTAQDALNIGLQDTSVETLTGLINKVSNPLEITQSQKDIILVFFQTFLKPNLSYNEDKTRAKIEREMASVQPLMVSFREGEPIIYKGDKVSKAQIEALQALNIYGVKTDFYKFFGIVLLTTILLVLIERFLCYFFSQYHNQTKYYFLLYTVILLTLLIEEGLRHFNGYYSAIDIRFMTPIPMASMLLSFLVAPGLALLCGTVICVLTAISFNMDFSLFVFLFISNCATAFLTYRKYSRSELIWAGYFVGIINLILVVTLGCVRDIYAWTWFVPNMGVAMLNGVVSSMLSLAILPYFESMFQMTTRQTLLELSNLNHPLLKRLMLSAPGTYQHSIMVANLAEAAAETVLADPVLTRVGAYFHDIGKIKRPGFFTENQTGENPHTGLAPRMSKLIIVSHVKDGLELAQKYKLPLPVQQIIAEHHGTSMVSFFYSQVIQTENIKDPDAIKDDFRYPGPKPHFKECGIVMLADSVEAASRSLEKPTYSKIEALVEKVFRDKISDGQMDECPLTLREIEKIKSTFLKVFKGIYHSRLDYEEELESIIKNANKES